MYSTIIKEHLFSALAHLVFSFTQYEAYEFQACTGKYSNYYWLKERKLKMRTAKVKKKMDSC